MRILLIEDEPDMASTLTEILKPNFIVSHAETGKDGIYQAAVNSYDLIVLDLGLPDIDGIQVGKAIRQNNIKSPILVLTGNVTLEEKVDSLESFADDYLTKPFHSREFSARIKALLRRNPDTILLDSLIVDDLVLNIESRQVLRQGREIKLGRREFDLLEYLMRHEGKVMSRSLILEHVWDREADYFTNFIDVTIKYLRDKVDAPYHTHLIQTVRGYGYKIEK